MFEEFTILVPVTIEGRTFNFLFDTGTTETLMNYEVAKQFNIRFTGQKLCEVNSPCVSFTDSVYYTNLDLYIQDARFNESVICFDNYNRPFSNSAKYNGYDGILGNRDIRKKNWLFDFENKYFLLADTTMELLSFVKEYDQRLDLRINNNHLNLYYVSRRFG